MRSADELASDLVRLLPRHLAAQRWYGGPAGPIEVTDVDVIGKDCPALVRIVVRAGGRWQLLLGIRPDWDVDNVGPAGAVGYLGDGTFCYDALADPELALAVLGLVSPEQAAVTVRPITAEQSNTSLVYDERRILKVFRRLDGPNPDVAVTTALAGAGFNAVADVVGVWRVDDDDCAILQRYLAGGVEGWALALTSLRDLFGSDAAASPADAGGDFAPEAARLGSLTAEMHLSLARALGASRGEPARWKAVMMSKVADISHADVDRDAVSAVLDRLDSVADPGQSVRVHGDYHLGQVLQTDEGWFVVDFEGEPAGGRLARSATSSPLRDVAGMLRSLHYAACVATAERGGSPDVTLRAEAWERHNRDTYLAAYRKAVATTGLVPRDDASFAAVLSAFELDKAVYELAYEQAHRPDWVEVALAGVRRASAP
jgi:predicted trehalose synthase